MTKSRQVADFGAGGFTAGKNKIINGDFGIWQRGTSGFTFGGGFNADRFQMYADGTGVTRAATQQTFTPGTAPVSGYEGTYYFRYAQTVAGTGGTMNRLYQKVEDVRVFAGQTVTLSFWAKADAARTITANLTQYFGTGGSSTVSTAFSGTASVTTSWQRFSFSVAVPSISGKTIGTSSYLEVDIDFPINTTQTIELWGVQFEAGSVATPFTTATGTAQGELAACQRYYQRHSVSTAALGLSPFGSGASTTATVIPFSLKTTLRTAPSSVDYTNLALSDLVGSVSLTAVALWSYSTNDNVFFITTSTSGVTAYRPYLFAPAVNAAAYIGISAEL